MLLVSRIYYLIIATNSLIILILRSYYLIELVRKNFFR